MIVKKLINKTYFFLLLVILFSFSITEVAFSQEFAMKENKPFSLNSYKSFNDLSKYKINTQKKFFLKKTNQVSFQYNQDYLIYDPERDPKRLLYNTGLYAGAVLVAFGILWVLPENISNWDKEEMKKEGLANKWKQNVKSGPIWDEDDFYLNYITHPWFGAVYYMSARGSGFKKWESFAFSAFMSTFFWEYGIEAFAEIPSWQDLIITPIAGSVLGEGFFIWKGNIIRNDRKILNSRALGRFVIFLMDPFNQLINGFGYKTKNKVQASSSIVPVGYNKNSKQPIWGMQVVINL